MRAPAREAASEIARRTALPRALERLPCLVARGLDALEPEAELVRIGAVLQRLLHRDVTVRQELHERLIEALHAVGGDALANRLRDERRLFRIDNILPDRGSDNHYFHRRDTPLRAADRDEPLGDDRLQGGPEKVANLLVLVRRKERDDPRR